MDPRIWRGPELGPAQDASLISQFLATARRVPDRAALIEHPGDSITSFGELARDALRLAGSLAAGGLGRGDVLAIMGPNSTAWVTAALGAMTVGAAVTGVNPALAPDELRRHLAVSGASVLAVDPACVATAEAARAGELVDEVVLLGEPRGGRYRTLPELIRGGAAATSVAGDPGDVALMPFSSGTSGLPKGVEITGHALALAAECARRALGLGEGDVLLAVAPFFHIMGMAGHLGAGLASGMPLVLLPKADATAMLELIERHRVTFTLVAPVVVRALAGHPALKSFDLSSLRAIACAGAPFPGAAQEAAADRLGVPVVQGYGLTETTGPVAVAPITAPRPGSCGRPAPGFQVRLVDPGSGQNAAEGASGEVWVRSAMLMRGYRDDPGATAETITADGWLRTGDLGRIDADGYLYVVDRIKELIKVHSHQVAPAELEAVLAGYPGVADVAVVGRPSAVTGETPVAYVVASAPVDAAAMMAWAAERVAPFKRLGGVELVETIPRLPSGKILRRVLKGRERSKAAAPRPAGSRGEGPPGDGPPAASAAGAAVHSPARHGLEGAP